MSRRVDHTWPGLYVEAAMIGPDENSMLPFELVSGETEHMLTIARLTYVAICLGQGRGHRFYGRPPGDVEDDD